MSLVFGHDREIAAWAFQNFKFSPTPYVMAIGILKDNMLAGAALFQEYNGSNVEVAYYGPNTMTFPIIRKLAQVAMDDLHVCRISARTQRRNKTMTRGIKKLGFVYEGIQKHFYGTDDAVMYGLYGQSLMKIAGKKMQ